MKIQLNKHKELTFHSLDVGSIVELKEDENSSETWVGMKIDVSDYKKSCFEEKYAYVDLKNGDVYFDYIQYPIVRKINAVLTEEE